MKLINEVERYVSEYFRENKRKNLFYHDILHTADVVKAAKEISEGSGLDETQTEIILIAAWFHDTGYMSKSRGHEEQSTEIAEKFLLEKSYPVDKIEKIKSCIRATKIPQKPNGLLDEILCDADLSHLGQKDFFEKNELLKLEFEQCDEPHPEITDWHTASIEFLSKHSYFTKYARDKFERRKQKNILKLRKLASEKEIQNQKENLILEKIKIDKEKLKDKKKAGEKSDRGIETMFRNVMRTHVEFSGLADNKANIMISVNTIVLTAIIAILVRKLDSNPHLIIPTTILTIVSLSTLIFATYVTRPKITDGTFSREDIKNKKANLLFFGNFYKMKLDEFTWGMQEMMRDKEYLYGSMIKDFYFLGQVLGRKYRYLNLCYSIFMFGMIISIIAFAIAVVYYGDGSEFGNFIE